MEFVASVVIASSLNYLVYFRGSVALMVAPDKAFYISKIFGFLSGPCIRCKVHITYVIGQRRSSSDRVGSDHLCTFIASSHFLA